MYLMCICSLNFAVSRLTSLLPPQLPDHITEMFAYSIAAAHLSLPHAVAQSFMVSHTEVETGEGWGLMDDSLDEQDCLNVQEEDLPHTFHFCQHYGLGKYFFSKYKLPTDFISCGAPLLKEPPRNVATLYNYLHKPSGVVVNFKSKKVIRRSAFAICHIVKLLNEAAEHFKKHHCSAGEANYNKTLVFHENMDDT